MMLLKLYPSERRLGPSIDQNEFIGVHADVVMGMGPPEHVPTDGRQFLADALREWFRWLNAPRVRGARRSDLFGEK